MGYFYIFFGYFYLIKSYELGKNYNHYTIATYAFLGCIANVLVSFILIPTIGQEGAMLAGLSTQILTTFMYHMKYFTRYSYKN